MTDEKRQARLVERVEAEIADPRPSLWWLSFIDPTRPQGERLLGVVVVHDIGPMLAVNKAYDLGVNPGGEVVIMPLPPEFDVPPEYRHRLLDRTAAERLRELQSIDRRTPPPRPALRRRERPPRRSR